MSLPYLKVSSSKISNTLKIKPTPNHGLEFLLDMIVFSLSNFILCHLTAHSLCFTVFSEFLEHSKLFSASGTWQLLVTSVSSCLLGFYLTTISLKKTSLSTLSNHSLPLPAPHRV